jgi:phosphoglycolate phosphatase
MISGLRNIIFDLDGTLTNPIEGIFNSLHYSLKLMHFNDIPSVLPPEFVGPPLQHSFKNIFGMNERETEQAVIYFREYYGNWGLYENKPYDGIEELLEELSKNGKKLYVATSKLKKYAWEVIRHFEFDKYIEDLEGADYAGNHSKSGLILSIMQKYRLKPEETLMIGDTLYDIEGAHEAGIKCIAVGYGFNSREILEAANPEIYVEDIEALTELLCY